MRNRNSIRTMATIIIIASILAMVYSFIKETIDKTNNKIEIVR